MFDLSTMNILLVVTVVALFLTFVLILMKLNPSTETKASSSQQPKMPLEKEKQPETPPQLKAIPPLRPPEAKISSDKPPVPLAPAVKPSPAPAPIRHETLPSVRSEIREVPKQGKPTAPSKAELTPTRKDCIHFYGYLHSLPKNTPIPDECFGCSKIVDCLISPNSSSNSNSKKRGG
jgi:hypothetical protein